MITALDTTILLDVLVNDPKHADRSESLLAQADEEGSLIISPAVYAELVPQARNRDELDGWLRLTGIRIIPFTADHGYTAGSRPCSLLQSRRQTGSNTGRFSHRRPR